METPKGTVIIVGASMAGLMAARALSPQAERVVIIERDRLPGSPTPRRGVPQSKHAHVLLGVGQQILEDWFPGIGEDLRREGAVPLYSDDMIWHQAGDYRVPSGLGYIAMSMSRPVLEHAVRTRLLRDHANVEILDGTRVDELLVDGAAVAGVLAGGRRLRSDLVVDCSGRNSRMFDLLARAGYTEPEESVVRIDVQYRTRVVPRHPSVFDESCVVLIGGEDDRHRIGTMVPIERDQWMITVASFHDDLAPVDEIGFERFAYSLPSPEIAEVVASAAPGGGIERHAMREGRRRRVEQLTQIPAGFVALGDAVCSFNPIYGQGMSSAALQAAELGRLATHEGMGSGGMVRAYYRAVGRIVDTPWRIAASGDFARARTTGDKPRGTDLTIAYLSHVFRASHTSPVVARRLLRVQNLLDSPGSLMTPAMMLRVARASRRSRVLGARRGHGGRPARTTSDGVSMSGVLAMRADMLTGGALSRAAR